MADIKFTVTSDNVKEEMNKVWQMANKGLKSGAPVIVTLGREGTTDLQEKCYHAMIGDIAKQVDLDYDRDTWKALLVSNFATEKQQMGLPLRKGNNGCLVCVVRTWSAYDQALRHLTRLSVASL